MEQGVDVGLGPVDQEGGKALQVVVGACDGEGESGHVGEEPQHVLRVGAVLAQQPHTLHPTTLGYHRQGGAPAKTRSNSGVYIYSHLSNCRRSVNCRLSGKKSLYSNCRHTVLEIL